MFFYIYNMPRSKSLYILQTTNSSHPLKWLLILTLIQLWSNCGNFLVSANFNLFLDRREFQKLHGISSDIYYVLEGVVNDYALSFMVTVPPEVDDLHFSWQALTKRPIHYDMTMEYTDIFALLPPVSNITSVGRVPHNLETFKVSLCCSGESNSEVAVTIRMNFHMKHPKPNTTSISIKRNKVCLFREMSPRENNFPDLPLPALFPAVSLETNLNQKPKFPMENTKLYYENSTLSLVLAGLLGGCAVTASIVFLTFFICLRRKLSTSPSLQQYQTYNDPNSLSKNSSPACLLRQSQLHENDSQVWKHFNDEKLKFTGTISSPSGSQNSYVTIASFWDNIFNAGSNDNNTRQVQGNIQYGVPQPELIKCLQEQNCSSDRGSDVSPYAYAHIVPKPPMTPPPHSKISSAPVQPSLTHWYSQSICPNVLINPYMNNSSENNNPLKQNNSPSMCTFNPKPNFNPRISGVSSTNESLSKPDPIQKHNSLSLRTNCDSFTKLDGFQCCKDEESNVVERFL